MSIDPDVHSSDLSLADLKQLPDVTFTFIYLFICSQRHRGYIFFWLLIWPPRCRAVTRGHVHSNNNNNAFQESLLRRASTVSPRRPRRDGDVRVGSCVRRVCPWLFFWGRSYWIILFAGRCSSCSPPSLSRRSCELNMATVPVYCICRLPYDVTQFMIECDACKDWFHGR